MIICSPQHLVFLLTVSFSLISPDDVLKKQQVVLCKSEKKERKGGHCDLMQGWSGQMELGHYPECLLCLKMAGKEQTNDEMFKDKTRYVSEGQDSLGSLS